MVSEAEQEGQREAHPGGFLEEADSEPRWDAPGSPKGIACQVGPRMSPGASFARQPGLGNGGERILVLWGWGWRDVRVPLLQH